MCPNSVKFIQNPSMDVKFFKTVYGVLGSKMMVVIVMVVCVDIYIKRWWPGVLCVVVDGDGAVGDCSKRMKKDMHICRVEYVFKSNKRL